MATAAHPLPMSVEEYLRTPFRPDVEYVDGSIEERNLGEADHGTLQFVIADYFHRRRKEWNVRMYLDTRMQTKASRFRVPDVSIAPITHPREQIVRTPPLLCVEVLSPEYTLRKMLARVQEYFQMGVPHVWIFDPQRRVVAISHPGGGYTEQRDGTLSLPGTPVAVDLTEIFAALEEA